MKIQNQTEKKIVGKLDDALDAVEPFLEAVFQKYVDVFANKDETFRLQIITRALVSSIASVANKKGGKFKLSNGLDATVHWLNGTRMRSTARFIKQYVKQRARSDELNKIALNEYYVVTVSIKHAKIMLVYHCYPHMFPSSDANFEQAKLLCHVLFRLHKHVAGAWENLAAIVYNHNIYSKSSNAGRLVLRAVENKSNPGIDALVR